MSIIRRHIDASGLPELEPVLTTWLQIIEEYCSGWEWKDNPYYYNEAASLSTFAGAVWRQGGFCLQEYSDRNGRGDLYFRLDQTTHLDFNVEAKQLKFPLTQITAIRRSEALLRQAAIQVTKYTAPSCRVLVGVFATPYLSSSKLSNYEDALVKWLVDMESIPAVCRTWFFVEPGQETRGRTGYYWPGVYLLIQEVTESEQPV